MIHELIAGDTLDFLDSVPEYPPADGWTLKYKLIPRFTVPAQSPVTITASTSGTQYRVQAAASITAGWKPGAYTWSRWVEKTGPIRQSLGEGQILVKTDPATAAQGYDGRSHARKVLDSIEAVLEGRATKDQEDYTIGNRSLSRTPLEDLLKLRGRYKAEVYQEQLAEAAKSGLGGGKLVARL